MKVSSYGGDFVNRGKYAITLDDMTEDQHDSIMKMMLGLCWVNHDNGNLRVVDKYKDIPKLEPDPYLEEHFTRQPLVSQPKLWYKKDLNSKRKGFHPSIYVQSITGYAGEKVYADRERSLTKIGFVKLRSKRFEDGTYWEIFYLPGDIFAKGPCKDMKIEEIVRWVCKHVGPGTIEIGGQHIGLCLND